MKNIKALYFLFLVFFSLKMLSQYHVDVANFNFQTRSNSYKENPYYKTELENYNLSIFLGKELKNKNVLFFSTTGEKITGKTFQEKKYKSDLSSLAISVGFQKISKSKKWMSTVGGISKWASDYSDNINADDWQYGGYFLQSYSPDENLKFKLGLYYNREAFGDFFIPLTGIDWKASERLKLYGTLPSFYKIEWNTIKDKMYCGLHFKTVTNSYTLSEKYGDAYVRYDDIQLKLFVEYFVYKEIMVYSEIGSTLGSYQLRYFSKVPQIEVPINGQIKMTPVLTLGMAYRIRFDRESSKQ